MTNEMMEHLTGSLWMITKPGGYAHLNQLGRIYRDKQQALKHKDFDEVVVELRLADEPSASQQARFKIGDEVIITRWNARAKVKGFFYELEDPYMHSEPERSLSPASGQRTKP